MGKHTVSDLYQMQSLPLSAKIQMTERRIREWVEYYGTDGTAVSFSGGKDSTILLHIVRKMYPDIPAVFSDTGLEYNEIREFVKRFENVEILRPKMNFRQVIEKYGYPFIGKEVAGCVHGARRYMEKLLKREMEHGPENGGRIRIPNHSYMADLAGIDRRQDKENELYQKLIRGEIPSTDIKTPVRYLILHGKYPHKEKGKATTEYSRMYNKERYKFFLEAPFEISENCCNIMKKAPLHSYTKRTGRMPMTAQMASESRLRTTQWLQNGCNGFHMKNPVSNPMSFWTEQDVLEYIYTYHIPIADVYGKVLAENGACGKKQKQENTAGMGIFDAGKPVYRTDKCRRTGCVLCGFGCHLEKSPNRWETAEMVSNPAVIDYMLRGGAFDAGGLWKPDNRGLGFWFVIEWINIHGNLNIIMPHRKKYLAQYMTAETQKHLKV